MQKKKALTLPVVAVSRVLKRESIAMTVSLSLRTYVVCNRETARKMSDDGISYIAGFLSGCAGNESQNPQFLSFLDAASTYCNPIGPKGPAGLLQPSKFMIKFTFQAPSKEVARTLGQLLRLNLEGMSREMISLGSSPTPVPFEVYWEGPGINKVQQVLIEGPLQQVNLSESEWMEVLNSEAATTVLHGQFSTLSSVKYPVAIAQGAKRLCKRVDKYVGEFSVSSIKHFIRPGSTRAVQLKFNVEEADQSKTELVITVRISAYGVAPLLAWNVPPQEGAPFPAPKPPTTDLVKVPTAKVPPTGTAPGPSAVNKRDFAGSKKQDAGSKLTGAAKAYADRKDGIETMSDEGSEGAIANVDGDDPDVMT